MKQNLKCKNNIIDYFDEDAYKCLIKKVIVGENNNENINPYVLNFILNSDNMKNDIEQPEKLKMQLAEFDCEVKYSVFNIDENNNRSKEIRNNIKVKIFSDIDTNFNIAS